jgi:hypothetical protein
MSKRPQDPAEMPDDDSPKLTRAELRRARPAREVLPGLIGEKAAAELLKDRGGDWADRMGKDERKTIHK